ncbi:hypothetical protein BS50DRAFT_638441 [Corynespora cassiicola Philippines]|uniref:Uncharacterized protein n=1 Tax=Corynespora cassiicola Philippines TaxID=1448308 RepID=A0A2T2NBM4_CORCC|nr:hypothetical protein BS50DRAFT_638441 [Corynespora cassiicola Philippines]
MDISISTVHNLLRIEDNLNLYEHSCSLISAIMVKFETVLMHELEVHGASNYRHSEYDVICSSIGWGKGLSIILASGKFSPNDDLIKDAGNVSKNISFYDVLDLAMQDKQIKSLDILAQAGYPVYPQVWFASIQYFYDLTAEWIAYFRTWKATPRIGQDTTESVPMQDRALGYFYIHVVGCASREVLVDFIGHEYRQMDKRQWKKILYDVVDSTRLRDLQKGLTVIRVWTFEALKLTHTCCRRICTELDEIRPILEEEIDDIRYIERADIQIFHDLMEEFDEAWGNHNGSFEQFVDNIWSSRMERVRQEASEYDSDHIEKVKEIGVRLWEPFGPQVVR